MWHAFMPSREPYNVPELTVNEHEALRAFDLTLVKVLYTAIWYLQSLPYVHGASIEAAVTVGVRRSQPFPCLQGYFRNCVDDQELHHLRRYQRLLEGLLGCPG